MAHCCGLSFIMLARFSVQSSTAAGTEPPDLHTQFVFFGTYTGEKSQGIYVAEFEPKNGQLGSVKLAAEGKNPTFLALDPQRRVLYAVNEINDFDKKASGAVSAFRVDTQTGKLDLLNQEPSGGAGPCHLATAQNGKCVLVANYGSGSVAVLPIAPDGRLRPLVSPIQHRGSSINSQRQEGPHAHFITWDPDNRFVLTCDLGLDKVLIYKLEANTLLLSPNDPPGFAIKGGSGPRHLAFDPTGRYAYVLNELSSTVTCCVYDQIRGELKEIQTVSTLRKDFTGANTCAEIQVHPSGKFLYASNRGDNTIAVFAISPNNGLLESVQFEPTGGKTPRHFCLDPSTKWLIAENQDSDNVTVMAVDSSTGRLTPTGREQHVGAPVCAVFARKQ
jgi:6-phosphogluconolactonase